MYGRTEALDRQLELDVLPRQKSWDEMVDEAHEMITRLRARGVKFEVEWHKRGDFDVPRVCTLCFPDEDRSS